MGIIRRIFEGVTGFLFRNGQTMSIFRKMKAKYGLKE